MNNHKGDQFCAGPSLPPGWLTIVTLPSSTREALLCMVNGPIPPQRSDLKNWANAITQPYIDQQLNVIQSQLIESQSCPKDVNQESLVAIASYTMEASFYKLLNGWGNTPKRSQNDLLSVAPYFRLLMESLRSLPPRFRYEGFGVRVLDASVPELLKAWNNYKEHFKVGRPVNFHSVSSFGYDERLLENFLEKGDTTPVIVLQCERIVGYKIDEISMIPRLGGDIEGEILMEGPSFFKVDKEPIKIKNYVIVHIQYDEKLSRDMVYLTYSNSSTSIQQGGSIGTQSAEKSNIHNSTFQNNNPTLQNMNSSTIKHKDSNSKVEGDVGKDEYIEGIQLFSSCEYVNAKELFELSATKGFPPSFERLCFLFSGNKYYKLKDENKYAYWLDLTLKNEDWFEKRTNSNDQFILLATGLFKYFIKKNYQESFKLWKLAANMGNSSALQGIGYIYSCGEGVEIDEHQGFKFFKLAADQGHLSALNNVGYCYIWGSGVEKDLEKGYQYLKIAADKGCALAFKNFGDYFSIIEGVETDFNKAFNYYKQAADMGETVALNDLGCCYLNGEGVEKNEKEAIRYFKMAADMNNSQALYNLGCCYEEGTGVEKNMEEAIKCLQLAESMRNENAKNNLKRILSVDNKKINQRKERKRDNCSVS